MSDNFDSKNNIFYKISDEDRNCLISCFKGHEKTYSKDERVCDYSEGGDSLGIITKGAAIVTRSDETGSLDILEKMGVNEIFGPCIYNYDNNSSVSVTAMADCRVLYLSFHKITHPCENICPYHTRLIENLIFLMSQKTKALSSRVNLLSKRSIREKLLYYFGELSAEKGSPEFDLPFSQTELAEFICCDRSAMVRELKKMSAEGIIIINKRKIKISQASLRY
jgi:CRP-like cAMP-binding protein